MTTASPLHLAILVGGLLTPSSLLAQQDAPVATPPSQPDPAAVLAQGLAKMDRLAAVTFRSSESQNPAMARKIQRQMGGMLAGGAPDEILRGVWSKGLLRASIHDGADEILSHNGRMVARNDESGWQLRRGCLANGASLPFVFDPDRFFEVLVAIPAAARPITSATATTYKDRKVLMVGMTLTGKHARAFALSGALPPVSGGMGAGLSMIRALAGAAAPAAPELTVDLVLYMEPATGWIHKLKSRTYQETAAAGIQFQVQGGPGAGAGEVEKGDDQLEAAKETDSAGKRVYKRGLPVRALTEDLSLMEYEVTLTRHDDAAPIPLDPTAKSLLRL